MMNIACIILVSVDSSFIKGTYVSLCNIYVAILGVVFATMWTNRQNWNQSNTEEDTTPIPCFDKKTLSTIRFDGAPYVSETTSIGTQDGQDSLTAPFVSFSGPEDKKISGQRGITTV
jgi:hypothetical protein